MACWTKGWDVPRRVDTLPVLEAWEVKGASQPTFVALRRVSATRFENTLQGSTG